ncbi:MAG: hypothetical protein IJD04_00920, partial [Desulfovibrionaceae bacterium]|nr:hypothetical protein [Desulfovibrionaceae bacterium]
MYNLTIPNRGPDWRKALFLAMLAYLLAFALRAVEIPHWDNPDYRLDGEYLLGTHDAYYWMAGAEGFGRAADHPFAEFIALLAGLTGGTPANVGFWLPLFMAPLVASVVCVWAMVFGARSSGALAGALACLAPGFLGRTLLGYCDTDLVTLLFALLMGLAPALWFAPVLNSPLRVAGALSGFKSCEPVGTPECGDRLLSRFWLAALLLSGLFGHWAKDWHSLFAYLPAGYTLLIPFLIALFGIKEYRPLLWRGAAVYALPLTGGAAGAAIALLAVCCLLRNGNQQAGSVESPGNSERHVAIPGISLFSRLGLSGDKTCFSKICDKGCELLWKRRGALLLWGLVFLFAFDPGVAEALLASVGSYVKSSGDIARAANATEALVYPGVAQSIIEVQDLKLDDLLFYFHPWPFIAVAGMFGFVILLLISPAAAFHLPLIALSLLSIKLGGRMVMFGVASVALGMTVPVYLLAEGLLRRIRSAGLLQALPLPDLLLLALLIPYAGLVPRLSHGPIMHVEYAEALKALRETTPPDAVIWTWWDWGYA